MIVITTPTGHIGSKVLNTLMQTNEKLRVIVRDPAKLSAEVKAKVEIFQGSLDDSAFVSKAYSHAEQVFFVIPPSNQYENVNEYYQKFSKVTCQAVRQQTVNRIVFVSGTGLGVEKNAGPVSASYLVEKEIEATGAATRILHCGTFMENLFHSLQPIKFKGQFGTSVPIDIKAPWVAAQDIADAAVKLLLDKSWSDCDSVGVLGPADLSYGEIAKMMTKILGKDVSYQEIAEESLKALMVQYGSSAPAAEGLVDIYAAMKNKTFNMLKRTKQNSSPTTFQHWLEVVFKPAMLK